ncbi:hypothetical protein B0H11DRAFT_287990 [Mycena galericulata]|nr:hypothetical protein B0H11DRAFT_287990 [Mycena galericulata]
MQRPALYSARLKCLRLILPLLLGLGVTVQGLVTSAGMVRVWLMCNRFLNIVQRGIWVVSGLRRTGEMGCERRVKNGFCRRLCPKRSKKIRGRILSAEKGGGSFRSGHNGLRLRLSLRARETSGARRPSRVWRSLPNSNAEHVICQYYCGLNIGL